MAERSEVSESPKPNIHTEVRIDLEAIFDRAFCPPVAPSIVDLEVLGSCPFRCSWCYGPDHAIKGSLNAESYANITRAFVRMGTERFVITGGEPLLRNDIEEILLSIPDAMSHHGHNVPIRLTLSTSGDGLLNRHPNVLDILAARQSAEIGLPLDGPSQYVNGMMRPTASPARSNKNFSEVMEIFRVLQTKEYAHISRKLRTVATAHNQHDISGIPEALLEHGINTSEIIWKIYQVNAHVGPRTDEVYRGSWQLRDSRFEQLSAYWHRSFDAIFRNISTQPSADAAERYTFIGPSADVRSVKSDSFGRPVDVEVGNLASDPTGTIMRLSSLEYAPYYGLSAQNRQYLGRMARL